MTITLEKSSETKSVREGQKLVVVDTTGYGGATLGDLVTVVQSRSGAGGDLINVARPDGLQYEMYAKRFRELDAGDRVVLDIKSYGPNVAQAWNGSATITKQMTSPVGEPGYQLDTDSGFRWGFFRDEDIASLITDEPLAEWELALLDHARPEPKLTKADLRAGDRVISKHNEAVLAASWTGLGTIVRLGTYIEVKIDHSGAIALLYLDEIDAPHEAFEEEIEAFPTVEDTAGLRSLGDGAVIRSTVTGVVYVKWGGKWRFPGDTPDFTDMLVTVIGPARTVFEVLTAGE